MKELLGITFLLFLVSSGFAFQLLQKNQFKDQQEIAYQEQLSKLLLEIENNSRERLGFEREKNRLQSEVSILNSQLTSVSDELQQTQNGSQDIQQIESEIRRHLVEEFRQREHESADSRIGMVRQLAEMDSMERSEFMSMQNRYGGFLGELDVDDARMETIVQALNNMIATENQARMEVMQQLQRGEVAMEELRTRMQGIHDQENQLNELSYVLSEDELALFSDYQGNRARPAMATFGAAPNGVRQNQSFFIGSEVDGSPGTSEIRIMAIEPD